MIKTRGRKAWRYTPEYLEKIRRMYWDEEQSVEMIAVKLGVQAEPLRTSLKRHGFAMRDLSEAARLRQARARAAE